MYRERPELNTEIPIPVHQREKADSYNSHQPSLMKYIARRSTII
jgi:hypothetical protein